MTFLDFGFRVKETLAKNHILFAVTYLDESGWKFLQKTFCKMHPKYVHESKEANDHVIKSFLSISYFSLGPRYQPIVANFKTSYSM